MQLHPLHCTTTSSQLPTYLIGSGHYASFFSSQLVLCHFCELDDLLTGQMSTARATEGGQNREREEGGKEQDFPSWQQQAVDQLTYNMKPHPTTAFPKGMASGRAF